MFQIITEEKVIRGNEIAFILFHNLPCSNTVLCTTTTTANTFNVLCNLFRVCKNTWLNLGEQLLLQKDLSSVVSSCYFPFSIPSFLDLAVFDLWTWIALKHFQQHNMIEEYASTKLHFLVVCCQYFFLDKIATFSTHLWLSNLMYGYTIDQWIFQWWALHLEFVWTLAGDSELQIWVLHHRANSRFPSCTFGDMWQKRNLITSGGKPRALHSPMCSNVSWIGKNFLFFPAPNSTYSSYISSYNCSYTDKASTNTSVSTVRITIFLWPCCVISFACRNTWVSAPSWLQGVSSTNLTHCCYWYKCHHTHISWSHLPCPHVE